jgi:hypothetical protein
MKTFKKPEKRGHAFKDDKYFIFSERSVHVMRPWPDPRSWVRTARKGWQAERKQADEFFCGSLPRTDFCPNPEPPQPKTAEDFAHLVGRISQQEIMKHVEVENRMEWGVWRQLHLSTEFFARIPLPVREILLQYRTRRWHVLSLLARCPGACDLHHSNPALCFALASNWVFHKPAVKQPLRSARRLLAKKQRIIQAWLGFPATESARRILAKIPPQEIDMGALLYLRQSLADPVRHKLLGHLPRLNADTLRLINSEWAFRHIHPGVLFEAAVHNEPPGSLPVYERLRDTLRMIEQLGDIRCPDRFLSVERLRILHDEVTAIYNDRTQNDLFGLCEIPVGPFPSPPFEGSDTIIPLTSTTDLFEEGREMHHCVGSYAHDVARGKCYIYRVTDPVRATLEIGRHANRWAIKQAKLACNKTVSPEIVKQLQVQLMGQ